MPEGVGCGAVADASGVGGMVVGTGVCGGTAGDETTPNEADVLTGTEIPDTRTV